MNLFSDQEGSAIQELGRLEVLRGYGVLDTPPEARFDDLTRLAARLCDTPMAVITLVDRERLFFKSALGMEEREAPQPAGFCCGQTIRQEGTLVIEDAGQDPRFAAHPLVAGAPRVRFYAGVPLITAEGQALGALAVMDATARAGLSEMQLDSLAILARQVMAQLELNVQSVKDNLTGLYNRRHMNEVLYREIKRLERKGLPLSIILMDVDHFRELNDTYGLRAGDAVLRRIGRMLRRSVRQGDLACRFEGDSFVVVMPEATLEVAAARGRDLLGLVDRQQIETEWEVIKGVTATVGVAAYPLHGDDEDALLRAAMAALREAREQGGDQVLAAVAEPAAPLRG